MLAPPELPDCPPSCDCWRIARTLGPDEPLPDHVSRGASEESCINWLDEQFYCDWHRVAQAVDNGKLVLASRFYTASYPFDSILLSRSGDGVRCELRSKRVLALVIRQRVALPAPDWDDEPELKQYWERESWRMVLTENSIFGILNRIYEEDLLPKIVQQLKRRCYLEREEPFPDPVAAARALLREARRSLCTGRVTTFVVWWPRQENDAFTPDIRGLPETITHVELDPNHATVEVWERAREIAAAHARWAPQVLRIDPARYSGRRAEDSERMSRLLSLPEGSEEYRRELDAWVREEVEQDVREWESARGVAPYPPKSPQHRRTVERRLKERLRWWRKKLPENTRW